MNNQNTDNFTKNNKLGTMKPGKLLFIMAVPAIISMLIQALYNVIDSIYVSNITTENDFAIDALSYAYPMQMILLAFAIGIGIGTNSIISRRLGEGRLKDASDNAKTGLIIAFISFLIFFVLSFFLPEIFLKIYKPNAETEKMAIDYLSINMMFSVGVFIEICCSKILQATGNMKIPMFSQLIGAVCNIILDPFFIFDNVLGTNMGLGLGVTGAAIATVISQIVSMIFVLSILLLKKHGIDFSFRGFKLKKANIKEILRVGFPVTVMNSVTSFTIIFLNMILMMVDPAGVTILGIYFKLQSFVFMPVFGLNQGSMPIMGFNYGAGNKKRFDRVLKLSIITSLCMLTVGTFIFLVFPANILHLFNLTNDKMTQGVIALRIISISFLPAAIAIVVSSMFQSLGQGLKSLIMSLFRQVVIIIPLSYILCSIFDDLIWVWIAFPVAEITSILTFIPVAKRTIDYLFNQKASNQNLEQAL